MTPMNESILKNDRQGRLRYTPEQKKIMVDAYRASGLSAPRFAAHHGVNYQTLVTWTGGFTYGYNPVSITWSRYSSERNSGWLEDAE